MLVVGEEGALGEQLGEVRERQQQRLECVLVHGTDSELDSKLQLSLAGTSVAGADLDHGLRVLDELESDLERLQVAQAARAHTARPR